MENMTCFISYTTRTENDISWAKWTEWFFREIIGVDAPIMQEYDFPPGSNFKIEMHKALIRADCVICVHMRENKQAIIARKNGRNRAKTKPKQEDIQTRVRIMAIIRTK